jgi:hypothetical protein
MHTLDSEVVMEIAQSDPVAVWIEWLEKAEAALAADGQLAEDSELVQTLSDLASTDPVARRLAADTQLRWRWDAVWAATDNESA